MAYATFETSIAQVRYFDDISKATLKELKEIVPHGAPWMIVTTDVPDKTWFMNWRIVRYYAPDADIWVMAEQLNPKLAFHVRREKTVGTQINDVYNVEVPKGGRIVWLLEPDGPFPRELEKIQPLQKLQHLFYTDVPLDAKPFRIFSFNFIPIFR